MADRVLVIDDDPHLLSALSRQLGERFDLYSALSGREGVGMVTGANTSNQPFAVVLCDMRMPGMNGIETLKAIRDIAPITVRMMLTGDADQQTAIQAINEGDIFRFYAKPCPAGVLGEGIAAGVRQSQLLQAERRLAENEERWRLALQAVGDGVWDWTPPTGRMVFSDGWCRMLGHEAGDVAETDREWRDRIHPEDRAAVTGALDAHLRGETPDFRCEHRLLCRAEGYRWFLGRGVTVHRAADGSPARVIGTLSDVTERRRMEEVLRLQTEELRTLATTDALTGLWNRRHFLEKTSEELSRVKRYGHPLSVMMVDIDFFKRVNDTHGHEAGDIILRDFAHALKRKLRRTDMVGRLGGEEFAVLLPETDSTQSLDVAESIRLEIAGLSSALPDGTTLSVTASFGVTAMDGDDETIADMLRRADEALYDAKQNGRNRVEQRTR
ncbi:MAG: diguanylate cyclase [Alphaproteobacteria bacterium]|nr:diguanylate cyclase [Alphaproteobacteria bacterium]